MNEFHHLGLSKPILKAIDELGFDTPSEIQQKAIPTLVQTNEDFVGLAQTGTGKTAAFGLPLLERIETDNPHIQALILSPTRELGIQITEQLKLFSKHLDKVKIVPVYGGASIEKQIKDLKKSVQIVVATPGRLVDLIRRKAIRLNQIEYVVLDEADEMLTMGFKEDLNSILKQTPQDKITWLFSATMSKEVRAIAEKYMFEPVEVRVNPKQQTNQNIDHQYATVRRNDKTEALVRLLDIEPDLRGIVFCRTRRETQDLAERLMKRKYRADALHGDLSQAQRDRVMRRFRSEELQVLIATDIAARGIDVSELSHVFHYSLPDENAYYTHRSGRTARAGKRGISYALVDDRDAGKIKRLQSELKIEFEKKDIPKASEVTDIRVENWCREILNQNTNKVTDELFDKARALFEDLSKEELVARIVAKEMLQLNQGGQDLNTTHSRDSRGSGKGRDRGRGRGRGDRRDGRRKSFGGKRKGDSKPKGRAGGKGKPRRRKR